MTDFRVKWRTEWPKPKWTFHGGSFPSRQKARAWCRNRAFNHERLTIVHPDGTEELFEGD